MKRLIIGLTVVMLLVPVSCAAPSAPMPAPAPAPAPTPPPPAPVPVPAPAPAPVPVEAPELAPEPAQEPIAEDAVEELWSSLAQYVYELELAEIIAKNKMNREAERLRAGDITTLELRKRVYYAIAIQAHTIEYIDSKPDYAILNTFLWFSREDKKSPKLAWCIPELAEDSERREAQCEEYFTNYIQMHYWAIDEFKKTLREYESEKP